MKVRRQGSYLMEQVLMGELNLELSLEGLPAGIRASVIRKAIRWPAYLGGHPYLRSPGQLRFEVSRYSDTYDVDAVAEAERLRVVFARWLPLMERL